MYTNVGTNRSLFEALLLVPYNNFKFASYNFYHKALHKCIIILLAESVPLCNLVAQCNTNMDEQVL